MAKQLQATGIAAPGFYGLNTQESSVTLDTGFANIARNCIIDRYGRLGSRKGWIYRTDELDSVADANQDIDLLGMHHFLDGTGTERYVSWNATDFFVGYDNLITQSVNTTDIFADGDWQAVDLNGESYYFQRGYKPLYYDGTNFGAIDTHASVAGTPPKANCVLSAYGRLWAADISGDKTTVYFTDLLQGYDWTGGGSLDISSVFTNGSDEIVGLGAHNGYLIIFCRNSIIIYGDGDNFQGSFTLTSLQLVEVIDGIGCISRDSIQNTGEDILFLSRTGVRSLNRTVQEKSQPTRDISKNVRDDLLMDINNLSDTSDIRSVYSPSLGFYLLMITSVDKAYYFDTKLPLPDGSLRVTTWTDVTHSNAAYDPILDRVHFTNADGIAQYYGYQDNGAKYRMQYYTTNFDMGAPSIEKILKRIGVTLLSSASQKFIIKVGTEYTSIYDSYPFNLEQGDVYEYGTDYQRNTQGWPIAEYGEDEFNSGFLLQKVTGSIGGYGDVIELGFEAEINGAPLSIQKIDLFVKMGRMI